MLILKLTGMQNSSARHCKRNYRFGLQPIEISNTWRSPVTEEGLRTFKENK